MELNLASQATRALTISDWSYQDCEEFLDDLEREFKKVNKALDTHSPMDCLLQNYWLQEILLQKF
jgi:hypothetical protein